MAHDLNQLQALVTNPSESLSVELKGWLNPKTAQHEAKIAKALLALRNQNGGTLILGIDGNTLSVDATNPKPADVRLTYHADEIQMIVSRYASDIFPVEVHFIEHQGETYPVICVPAGVKTIVAAKQSLLDGGKLLVKEHQVYVRTLNSNGTVSTSEARHDDWEGILEICMDNREADVARFLRRYFGDRDVKSALQALGTSLEDRLFKLQQGSFQRFNAIVNHAEQQIPTNAGWWDVAAIIEGKVPERRCNSEFRNLIIRNNPRYTGWPLWVDGQGIKYARGQESPVDNFWECALVKPPVEGMGNLAIRNIDFWRISPIGEMYVLRFLEDDLLPVERGVPPLTVLDFAIVTWRTTEALLVPLAFAKAMGCDPDACSINYRFSWARLKDRGLTCWSDMRRAMYFGKAGQESIHTLVKVPLSVAPAAIAPYVHQVVVPLFELFGGTEIKLSVITSIVDEMLKRR
ncbi:MAG: ATP-binding protein [Methylacidiphilales bacterium]|nr:ATP-binding protein [Candidatus Methylacidiphilales bacterium]